MKGGDQLVVVFLLVGFPKAQADGRVTVEQPKFCRSIRCSSQASVKRQCFCQLKPTRAPDEPEVKL